MSQSYYSDDKVFRASSGSESLEITRGRRTDDQ